MVRDSFRDACFIHECPLTHYFNCGHTLSEVYGPHTDTKPSYLYIDTKKIEWVSNGNDVMFSVVVIRVFVFGIFVCCFVSCSFFGVFVGISFVLYVRAMPCMYAFYTIFPFWNR